MAQHGSHYPGQVPVTLFTLQYIGAAAIQLVRLWQAGGLQKCFFIPLR